MKEVLKIKSITNLHEAFDYEKPGHPLISVLDLSKISIPNSALNKKVVTPFYNISLKTMTAQAFKYGRKYFDFSEGFLLGIAPNQVLEIDETSEKGVMEGWA